MRYYVFILSLFILFSSCNKEVSIDSFDIVDTIVDYDSLFSDKNTPLGEITGMEVIEDIIITNHTDDDYYFSFINANNGKLMARYGGKGRGPNEYMQLGSTFMIYDSQIVFSDATTKELNYVSILDILNGMQEPSLIKKQYPYTMDFRPRDMVVLDDQTIALGSFKEGRFGVLNSDSDTVYTESDYPFHYDQIKGIMKGSVFQGEIKSNRKKNRFVISIFSSDIFEIYQITNNKINSIYTSNFKYPPKIWEKGNRYTVDYKESIAGIMNLSASENLICFTYSLRSYEEFSHSGFMSNEILCYNWNGEKVKKYILPFYISTFCVDKLHIYGVRCVNNETIIYRFKL